MPSTATCSSVGVVKFRLKSRASQPPLPPSCRRTDVTAEPPSAADISRSTTTSPRVLSLSYFLNQKSRT
eukprot:3941753-Rhodomonas_salina.2